ncbi:MAG: gamma-glutamyltransferase, partial [Gemmatimonadaceae bacterium]|nr:gamma-glutamyltransferase [Gemmatimonadaceae bacterium]
MRASPLSPVILCLLAASVACAPSAVAPAPTLAPTLAPDLGKRVVALHGVVTSAHPLASEAGLAILRQGGNAVDAAVAAAFAVGVVEPNMSGVGGSGAMLMWQQRSRRADYLDFYAAQPTAAFAAAGITGPASDVPLRNAGVPGEVAGLLAAHERFGTLPLATVLAPAIRVAEEGFPLYQVLGEMVERDTVRLGRDAVARALFWRGDTLKVPGDRIVNPELAMVMRRIATQGRAGFYEGETARAVVERMNAGGHPVRLSDFAAYQPVWKRPLCTTYRADVVLSAPPPQGGMQLVHSLKLLEPYDLRSVGLPTRSAEAFDIFTSALRVGQAGTRGSDDPRWTVVPARGAVSSSYAAVRHNLVGTGRAADTASTGAAIEHDAASSPAACAPFEPYGEARVAIAGGFEAERAVPAEHAAGGETTHISVVDAEGNAVAVTVTNSSVFGNRAGVLGFFLNDSGISFFRAADLARADAPAWRTRISTIAPTLVVNDRGVRMVVGSPGGGRIPFAMM